MLIDLPFGPPVGSPPGSSKNVAKAADSGSTLACQPQLTQLFQSRQTEQGIAGQDYPVILSFQYRTGLLPFNRLKARVTIRGRVSFGGGPAETIGELLLVLAFSNWR